MVFARSDPRHLHSLIDSYDDVTVIRLERNFRSRQGVLDVANAVRPCGDEVITLHGDRGEGPKARLLRCYDAQSRHEPSSIGSSEPTNAEFSFASRRSSHAPRTTAISSR